MSATPSSDAVDLHAHGIVVGPRKLQEMVRVAVASLREALYPEDPRTELSSAEVDALEAGGFDLRPRDLGERDPLALTAAEYAALLGTSLSTTRAARRLGVTEGRIRQRLTASPPSLYGVRTGGKWRLPELQFDGAHVVPGFDAVAKALRPGLHPVAFCRWFTSPDADLVAGAGAAEPWSPREWLRRGYAVEPVAVLAAGL